MNWLTVAGSTALFWGGSSILAKIGTIRLRPRRMLLTYGLTITIFYWIVWELFGTPFPPGNYLFPLLSEGCAAISFIFYYRALERGPVSLIAPLTSSSIIISILIGVFVFKNPITSVQIFSISSITIGIILLTLKKLKFTGVKREENWVFPAFLAMLGWGIWGGFSEISVDIVRPINLNLFFAVVALLIWTPYFFIKKAREKRENYSSGRPDKKNYLFAAGSAFLSGSGSLLFYIAVNMTYVSLVIPVSNLHPLVSILYDIFKKNYPRLHQWVGIALILTGLFFINGG